MKSNARILNSTCLFIVRAARFPANAFTLFELVISIAITVSVLFAAATIAVSELRSSIKLYVYQALRDQAARVTFLIEAEVSEASSFLATEPAACETARNLLTNTTFLFALRHSYLQGPSFTEPTRANPPAASNICYFNRIVNNDNANPVFDLYRFGPPFDPGTGVLSSNAAATTLISPGTRLINSNGVTGVNININAAYWPDFATCTDCDGHSLSYRISLQHDTSLNSANPKVWNHSYSPANIYTARILSFCVSSATNSGWCST